MKNLLIITAVAFGLFAFNMPAEKVFHWTTSTTYDFGQIPLKVPAKTTFEFQNTGDMPIIITSAKGSCGCTVADYTKEEIQPGAYGQVSATYNAAKIGSFQKSVTIESNIGEPVKLFVKGEVVE